VTSVERSLNKRETLSLLTRKKNRRKKSAVKIGEKNRRKKSAVKIGGKNRRKKSAKYRRKSAKKSTKIMTVPRLPSTAVNVPISVS
jgi:hypothetical protein